MIGNILNIARSAIVAHQTAVQVTSQNVSNAQTPGYTRQRATLESGPGVSTLYGRVGSGVAVRDISRTRDALLDLTYRREAGNSADFEMRRQLLGQVEELFGELSDSGFSATMDSFWASWSDLANNPENGSVRGLVKQQAGQVAFALNNYSGRLGVLRENVTTRLERSVEEVNHLARQLADINRQVATSEASGRSAPDLRDNRDRLLDELSQLARIQVVERRDNTVAVYLGTSTLVDGTDSRLLRMDPPDQELRIGSTLVRDVGGSLGAMVDLRDQEIPLVARRLDDFARTLVEQVNAIHVAGTGREFFDSTRLTAGVIALSTDVDDPNVIGTVPGAPGDNRVALELAALRERDVAFATAGPRTFGGFYGELIADVGLKVNSAERSSVVYGTLASQADIRRSSVGGVSTDEEMMNLMKHQQAYAAATRLVQVADEMMKTVLNMV